ncbi:MAG TPA: AMP-binding protein [Bacteroidales bacterium]|nr:AMP-binding protein [Bacteroidales bacterium]
MDEISPRSLLLNGTWFNDESLPERILRINKGSHTEKDVLLQKVFFFLEQWLNDDPCITLQTSGSTGAPKQIRIKKEFMLNSAIMTGNYFGLRQGMNALLCLSPDFIAGKMMVLRSMVFKLNLITSSTESNPIKNLEVDIDFAAMVPLQVAMTLQKNPDKLDRIKTLIIGGGPLSISLEESLQSKSAKCWHTYGMTETVSHIALRPINGIDRSSWFAPLPGVIVSLDKRGCLTVNAPLISEDVVITNDLAKLNGQKFQITGRIDEVIVSAGLKLHPGKIEKKT